MTTHDKATEENVIVCVYFEDKECGGVCHSQDNISRYLPFAQDKNYTESDIVRILSTGTELTTIMESKATPELHDASGIYLTPRVLPGLTNNSEFESASTRFIFTMRNQSALSFILDGMVQESGKIEILSRELNSGTKENESQLVIRGYKKPLGFYGVHYTFSFRILRDEVKDTAYRLHIMVWIGYIRDSYFGWYISNSTKEALTPKQWWSKARGKGIVDTTKSNATDENLNTGGRQTLLADFKELELQIEMLTDNETYSMPSMIIRHSVLNSGQ